MPKIATEVPLRALLAAIVIAQLLDLITYLLMIARLGDGAESNLIVRLAYYRFGVIGPVALKLTLVGFVCVVVWLLTRSTPPHRRIAFAVCASPW